MSDLLLGLTGAAIGLTAALFGNLVVLPMVLRRQEAWIDNGRKFPILGSDKAKVRKLTRFLYRVQMPVLFSFVGAASMVAQFGSDR